MESMASKMDEDFSDNSVENDDDFSDYDDTDSVDSLDIPVDVKKARNDEDCAEDCQVLTEKEVSDQMKALINDTSEMLQLPPTIARHLLNYARGDKEKLCDLIYEPDRRRELFAKVRIADPSAVMQNGCPEKDVDCEICYTDSPKEDCFSSDCGHFFCKSCWQSYLIGKIIDEGSSSYITCPQHKCFVAVDDESVRSLIDQPEIRERFSKGLRDAYVQCNACLKPCPRPDCGHVIQVKEPGMKAVKCKCDYEFCFYCGSDLHCLVQCDLLKKWDKKSKDDSETLKWLTVNTKDCPKCFTPIEKNGGCNWMKCRQASCGCEFCWICHSLWSDHTQEHYRCNRYEEKRNEAQEEAVKRSKEALDRYHFYYQRYATHFQSLKFEEKLRKQIADVMTTLQKEHFRWIDVQCLNTAQEILHRCRTTLMYTFVFSFYLERTNEAEMFEGNQANLHEAVEMLSKLLEDFTDLLEEEGDINEHIMKIQDKYRFCETRRTILEDHVKEGYKQDVWQFQDL